MIFPKFELNSKGKDAKWKPNPICKEEKHSLNLLPLPGMAAKLQLQMDQRVSGADRSALSCFSDTVRHSILVRNAPIYPDYSAEPLNQPNLISLTVNHLDVFFPVWLWIHTNERGGRHRKGNSRDGSGHGGGKCICKAIIYYHSRT